MRWNTLYIQQIPFRWIQTWQGWPRVSDVVLVVRVLMNISIFRRKDAFLQSRLMPWKQTRNTGESLLLCVMCVSWGLSTLVEPSRCGVRCTSMIPSFFILWGWGTENLYFTKDKQKVKMTTCLFFFHHSSIGSYWFHSPTSLKHSQLQRVASLPGSTQN